MVYNNKKQLRGDAKMKNIAQLYSQSFNDLKKSKKHSHGETRLGRNLKVANEVETKTAFEAFGEKHQKSFLIIRISKQNKEVFKRNYIKDRNQKEKFTK